MAVAVRAALHAQPIATCAKTTSEERHAAAAFEGDEMARGTDVVPPSRWLADQVAAYEKQYQDDGWRYHSPYASILAPSGAGKSFTVVKMATQDVYVVYCNLEPRDKRGIPGRTALADAMDKAHTAEQASKLWQRFGQLGLAIVTEARALQLTPSAFVAIQYRKEHALAQQDLVALLDDPECWRHLTRSGEPEKPTCACSLRVRAILTGVVQQHKSAFSSPTAAHKASTAASVTSSWPLVVFAFDEARSLLRPASDTNMLCLLRRALCEVWNAGQSKQLRVFALLLDTSSKLNNFVPESAHDPSAKRPIKNELFPPIYQLQTWDVMHQKNLLLHHTPDGSAAYWQYVLTLGRPLWGAVLLAHLHDDTSVQSSPESSPGSSPSASTSALTPSIDAIQRANAAVFGLARSKLRRQGQEPNRHHALALLSFRLGFDEIHQELGRHLVSDWLHFPIFLNDTPSLMRTTQPSEPILALAAAAHHQDPTQRKEGIDALVAEYQSGAWHCGDIREIVGALLLLWASEVVWTAHPPTIPTRPLNVVLTNLAGCVPDGWPVLDAYDVHLTHMVRCRRDQPITADDMKLAFLTGQGWFPCRAFPGVDIIVPLCHRDTHRIAVLVVQIKNRKEDTKAAGGLSTDAASAFQRVYSELPYLRAVDVFGLCLALRPGTAAPADRVQQAEPTPWHTLPQRDQHGQGQLYGAIRVGFDDSLYPVLRRCFDDAPFLGHAVVTNLTSLLRRGEFNVSEKNAPYVASLLDRRDPAACLPSGARPS